MPEVTFAQALQSHVSCPPQRVDAGTVRGALEAAFTAAPRLRGYVLDDQGALRPHVAVFVDGRAVADRSLEQAVPATAKVHVVQALSGG